MLPSAWITQRYSFRELTLLLGRKQRGIVDVVKVNLKGGRIVDFSAFDPLSWHESLFLKSAPGSLTGARG
jgi:hypothetical protein